MDLITVIQESRFEKGQGSALGRKKIKGKGKVESEKSRVKVYDTIMQALHKGHFGQMFSTKGSDRLYVITKSKWGKDPDQRVGRKVAKGFTPGSAAPGASFKDVKGYSVRTSVRHGKQKADRLRKKKYWKSGFRDKR